MREEKNKYIGMTLNEMLFETNLMGEFDRALNARNKAALVQILHKINIPNRNAKKIIKAIFDNPRKYGY